MPDILNNYVKFLRGTPAAYEALSVKDKDTLYFIVGKDDKNEWLKVGKLYLGDILVAGNITENGDSMIDTLGELTDVNVAGALNGQVLGFNGTAWIPMNLPEALEASVMTGATSTTDGTEGYVPAPQRGDEGKFLRGDGTWAAIETSSTTQVFEADVEAGADHVAAITTAVGENSKLQNGDVAIVRELIANGKKQYTAYVYKNNNWVAMDGNYNAENVYFDEDFVFTTKIGTVQTLTNGSTTVDAAGKNIKEFFASLFAAESQPTITSPSYSLSASATLEATAEVGNYITGYSWDGSWSAGSYSYGSKENSGTTTGITATYAVSENKESKTATTLDGSFTLTNKIQIDTVGEKTYATVSGKCTYTDSPYTPVTNIGNAASAGSLEGDEISKSANVKVTGYRSSFSYVGTDCTTAIDSAFIRGTKNHNANTKAFGTVTIPAGTKRVMFAVPGSATLKSVIDVDGMGLDVKDNFTTSTIKVKGANNFTEADYTVFVTENANGMSATKFTVSIS